MYLVHALQLAIVFGRHSDRCFTVQAERGVLVREREPPDQQHGAKKKP